MSYTNGDIMSRNSFALKTGKSLQRVYCIKASYRNKIGKQIFFYLIDVALDTLFWLLDTK